MRRLLLLLCILLAAPALAEPIPDVVARMLDAASPDQLRAVADVARKTNPASIAEIDARVAAINDARAKAREERLAEQGLFEGWRGQVEAGGFISSGNTSNRGLAIGANLAKETRHWKHALRGVVDFQQDKGVTTRERYFAGYEGNWKFSPRGFVVMALSFERDRFSGFTGRYAESLGIGYRLIDGPKLSVALDGGPAFRQTMFTNGAPGSSFAARAALNAKWQIASNLSFTETATYFADDLNSSVLSLSQLTARLNGRLSARLSYQLNSESNPPPGRENVDTVSRATLVYNF